MRNRYAGICYRCGKPCAPGAGHFERHAGGWRVQHAACCIAHRESRLRGQQKSVPITNNTQ
jgi:hypothetical protein